MEPGPAGTNFKIGLVEPEPMAAYAGTPSDTVRRSPSDGSFKVVGDARKLVHAVIALGDGSSSPLRLTLGGSSYDAIRAALVERIAALDA